MTQRGHSPVWAPELRPSERKRHPPGSLKTTQGVMTFSQANTSSTVWAMTGVSGPCRGARTFSSDQVGGEESLNQYQRTRRGGGIRSYFSSTTVWPLLLVSSTMIFSSPGIIICRPVSLRVPVFKRRRVSRVWDSALLGYLWSSSLEWDEVRFCKFCSQVRFAFIVPLTVAVGIEEQLTEPGSVHTGTFSPDQSTVVECVSGSEFLVGALWLMRLWPNQNKDKKIYTQHWGLWVSHA